MPITFFKTIRGTELEIMAAQFDGDPSVGINYGPEEITVKTLDGNDFELTDEELEQITIEATEIWYDQD